MYVPCELEQRLKIHGREELLAIVVLKLSNRRQPILLVDETKSRRVEHAESCVQLGLSRVNFAVRSTCCFPARTRILFAKTLSWMNKGGISTTRCFHTGRGDHLVVNEVTFSRDEPQHARLPTKRVRRREANSVYQLARFSSHYWLANSLGFLLFSPQTFAHWSRHWPSAWQRHEILRQRSCRSQL